MTKTNTWDRFADGVARWAGIGNNRDETDPMTENPLKEDIFDHTVAEDEPGYTVHPGDAASPPMQTEVDTLRAERDQLMDRLARLQAEFDNARKREARERADSRDYTISSTVEPFLGVMDNFQLALKADGTAEQLRGGVELILKQMEDALRSLNVQPVESLGAQFDPRLHEALGNIETAEFPDHQVLEEIRRGYRIRDKLLRPALVRIASNPGQVSD
jgi:molecular chaperone GrpE